MQNKNNPNRKIALAKEGRKTGWAPIWVVIKKFGMGKKIHPSQVTKHRRSWRRTKLHIKPRIARPKHLG
ncbi:MAG: hypothetical protein AABX30_02840 [Nanoarchaeota archaeon]